MSAMLDRAREPRRVRVLGIIPVVTLCCMLVIPVGTTQPAAAGTAWGWGANSYGQLGSGLTESSGAPVQVPGLRDLVGVSCGAFHTLGVKSDGTVWAWGSNQWGQLGDGMTTDSASPVQVSGLTGAVAVAGGRWEVSHSLALTADGTVWAWGNNTYGQLGNGTRTSSPTPVQVPGLSDIVAVAAGGVHSLALKGDGTLWAWGFNGRGALGNGTTTSALVPVQVWGLTDVIAVAGSEDYSMALGRDGTAWAWGYNGGGQLGNGTTEDSAVPVPVVGLGRVIAIGAGSGHALAVREDGTVWAWGWNGFGQLGNGGTVDSLLAVPVSGLSGAVAVAGGMRHSAALLGDGTVWAWGTEDAGQLGNGIIDQTGISSVPVKTITVSEVRSITCGQYHSFALAAPVPEPAIAAVTKAGGPFRLIVKGTNLQQGMTVLINGQGWSDVARTSMRKVVIEGGARLKFVVPRGQPAHLRFVNPDGGSANMTFVW